MNCERCGVRAATVRYTEYAEGPAKEQNICAECASALGFGERPPAAETRDRPKTASDAPSEIAAVPVGASIRPDGRCSVCGLTGAEFAEQSLFGCPHCYEEFDDDLDALLKRLHGATTHRGRLPQRPEPAPPDESALRKELDDALARHDFERAARLRDRLRATERGSHVRPPGAEGAAS